MKSKDVHPGKMMSSPGLKYQNKVFAFFHKNTMGFRLGPEFDPEHHGLQTAHLLNPFKNKPPLRGWYIIESTESDRWNELSDLALSFTKRLK